MIRQVSYSLILARSGRGLLPTSIQVRRFTDNRDVFKPKKTEVASVPMAPKGSKADAKPEKEEKVKAKRAPSSYILFCSEKRPEVKIKFPDASFGETGKILGQMWSQLSEKDKAVYNAQSQAKKAALT